MNERFLEFFTQSKQKMSTKMKGLFKGLRYISQIFDEEQQKEKEQDMQIGLPTDVKHVAHIGWDGDAADSSTPVADSPGWMRDFSPSAPPGITAPAGSKPSKENGPEVKWVSEDSKRGHRKKKSISQEIKEPSGEGPKAPRRLSTDNNSTDTSPKKPTRRQSTDNASAKPRQSRRNTNKDCLSDGGGASDVPKRSRRKKSESNEGGMRRAKNRSATANGGDSAAETQLMGSDVGEEDEEREESSRAARMKEPLQN